MTRSTLLTMLIAVGWAALWTITVTWADSRGNMSGTFGSFPQTTGKELYDSICQGCHMPDGRGATGAAAYPALTNDAKLAAAGYPVYLVVYGENAMPGFGGFLNDEQVAAVVNYVRTNFGNHYTDAVKPDDVKAIRQPGYEYSPLE